MTSMMTALTLAMRVMNFMNRKMTSSLKWILTSLSSSPIVHAKKIEKDYYYEVLSTEDIMKHMVENINEVNSVTQIPATTTRILLHHFKWDKEKLIDRFYSENQEEMFKKAQVISPCKTAVIAEKSSRPGSG